MIFTEFSPDLEAKGAYLLSYQKINVGWGAEIIVYRFDRPVRVAVDDESDWGMVYLAD